MSREDLELAVRGLNAAGRRPKPDFDTINAVFHPDHVFVPVVYRELGEGTAKGAGGYRSWLAEIENVMPTEWELEGAIDVVPGMVLAVANFQFEGGASGIGGEGRIWILVTVADGKLTRTEVYFDPAEALAAVGSSE